MNMENLTQRLRDFADKRLEYAMFKLFQPILERMRAGSLSNPGLEMKASQKTVVKISASDYYYMVKGKVLKLESDSTMGALSGTVLQDTNNIFVFMIDENGNTTTRMGTGAAALSNVVWPVTPSDQAIVGLVIISPVGGNFIGGTTALDDVTVVPNAVFINFTHTVDPTTKPF